MISLQLLCAKALWLALCGVRRALQKEKAYNQRDTVARRNKLAIPYDSFQTIIMFSDSCHSE